jgi:hypothetical protein
MFDDPPQLCSRCLATLEPGRGGYFVVSIEAVADPSPPVITDEELERDHRREWRRIVEALQHISPQEALDQVYRRVVIHLCNECFADWIEHPAG